MEKIAIYGGSFNPPTIGHKNVITKVLESNIVQKIIFSPDGERFDKSYNIGKNYRIEMMNIFYEDLKNEGYNIEFDDYFLTSNPSNTSTIQVEKYFSEKLGFQPYHIFGSDVIGSMPNWAGNKEKYIENKLKKIFLLRKGFSLPKNISMQNYIFIDLDILEISSTIAREMIKNKLNLDNVLSKKIYEYVLENGLYK